MARKRNTGDKPYRFAARKGRPIQVQFDHIPGRWISTGSFDMPAAVDFAERWLEKDHLAQKHVPTFSQFARGYYSRRDKDSIWQRDRLYGHEYAEERYLKNQWLLDRYIMPKFGMMLVTAINIQMIEDWIPYIKPVSSKETLSSDMKNKILVVLRQIMDDVKRQGYRQDNPATESRSMARRRVPREALPPQALLLLFPADTDERIRVWDGLMWATYFSIAYDTGWRPGEIAALRVCDVWQTGKGLAVATERTVNRNSGQIVDRVKTTGKGYSQRVGLLDEVTASLLLRLISERGLGGTDLLFEAGVRKDGLIMPETSNKHFKSTLKKLGLYHKGLVQYCLRHTYTTERRGDMPDDILAISMGHTRLRSDYDHQQAADLIRRLDARRDDFFINHSRLGEDDGIRPITVDGKGGHGGL